MALDSVALAPILDPRQTLLPYHKDMEESRRSFQPSVKPGKYSPKILLIRLNFLYYSILANGAAEGVKVKDAGEAGASRKGSSKSRPTEAQQCYKAAKVKLGMGHKPWLEGYCKLLELYFVLPLQDTLQLIDPDSSLRQGPPPLTVLGSRSDEKVVVQVACAHALRRVIDFDVGQSVLNARDVHSRKGKEGEGDSQKAVDELWQLQDGEGQEVPTVETGVRYVLPHYTPSMMYDAPKSSGIVRGGRLAEESDIIASAQEAEREGGSIVKADVNQIAVHILQRLPCSSEREEGNGHTDSTTDLACKNRISQRWFGKKDEFDGELYMSSEMMRDTTLGKDIMDMTKFLSGTRGSPWEGVRWVFIPSHRKDPHLCRLRWPTPSQQGNSLLYLTIHNNDYSTATYSSSFEK